MPVHFACPQCRQLLKISRRKIGTICECPRCGNPTAVPTPTTTKRELAHSSSGKLEGLSASSSRLESVSTGSVSLFDDINELLAHRPVRPANVAAASASETRGPAKLAAVDAHWSQPAEGTSAPQGSNARAVRGRFWLQCGLATVAMASAFAAGYFLGHSRPAPADSQPAAAQHTGTAAISPAASAPWPTPAP